MRIRPALLVIVVTAAALPLLGAGATPAGAACKSPMKPGKWSGPITQDFTVQGTAQGVIQVDETGRTDGTMTLDVACNGKVKGTFAAGSFRLTGTYGAGPVSFPIDCTATSVDRPVTGKVTKGAGGKPVIDITYGQMAGDTFSCAPGPIGDAITSAFDASGAATGATVVDAPTGLTLPATKATRTTVSGTSFQSTGGFDPIAVATANLSTLGLTPQITQAWTLTRG